MRQLQPVVWSKGTFLSPQHLQAQERFVEDTLSFYVNSLSDSNWGLSKLRIDEKAISEGILTLLEAKGIFPDALPVDVPDSDPPPHSRALGECFRGDRQQCTFFLAIPGSVPGGMNIALKSGTVNTRFAAHSQMLRDENTGTNEKSVQIARKNLQIIAEGENSEGSVLLPLAKIERTESGMYRLVGTYVPPLTHIGASSYLTGLLRSLIELLIARSGHLSAGRRQRNQSLAEFSASDIAEFWLLYTINTHLPGLRHLLEAKLAHPEDLFALLSELAGALTTFHTQIHPRDLPGYKHEQLGECFFQLDTQLRLLLDTLPKNFVALALKPVRDGIYATSIEKDAYFENSRFYLAINADVKDADLILRVPKLLKVGSATTIENLVSRALPGARLSHVESPPRAIPVKLQYKYFSVERAGADWEAIQRGRSFAVYSPSGILNPVMELIILLPSPE